VPAKSSLRDRPPSLLITGGNSKFGKHLVGYFAQHGWEVNVVPREFHGCMPGYENIPLSNETWNWHKPHHYPPRKDYDLIIFNHNRKPPNPKLFCNSDVDLLEYLDPYLSYDKVKVGWMVTGDATRPKFLKDQVLFNTWSHDPSFQLYIAQKALYISRCRYYALEKGWKTFCVDPGHIRHDVEGVHETMSRKFLEFVSSDFESGCIKYITG